MFVKDKKITNLEFYKKDSRYVKLPMYYDRADGEYFIDLPESVNISSTSNDFFYKVNLKTQNRLDLIANMYYKNSRLWWVIAEANKISDATNVPQGTILIIPSMSSIFGVGGVLG